MNVLEAPPVTASSPSSSSVGREPSAARSSSVVPAGKIDAERPCDRPRVAARDFDRDLAIERELAHCKFSASLQGCEARDRGTGRSTPRR